jgi:hypothetical protein
VHQSVLEVKMLLHSLLYAHVLTVGNLLDRRSWWLERSEACALFYILHTGIVISDPAQDKDVFGFLSCLCCRLHAGTYDGPIFQEDL